MSAAGARRKIEDGHKVLQQHWQRSWSSWQDSKRHEFGRTYIEPIEPAVRSAVLALEKLALAIAQARRDCE